jgi:type I restriction-modification system DNA methylase subunit
MTAPSEIRALVERFHRNSDDYRSQRYNETQLRNEFLDPFFEALGWDVHNRQGYAEAYKDVIHEDALKIGGSTKAPDYSFRVGGTRKFFLEAKKPAIDIRMQPEPAFQLRRYAWSAKLSLSILSDFQEMAVYDTRVRPDKRHDPGHSRIMMLRYGEYADRWDEIADIFSREAILRGAFDRFADETRAKRGTTEVDDAFLSEIENWRDLLARNLALRNPNLTQRELNFAVQRTIDRIVFLRICEDRGIETYGRLQALRDRADIYTQLLDLFRQADERYNSGLFHFQNERDRIGYPDTLTPGLKIDDRTLKEILGKLYYPDSPYEFSVLPSDILGQVYEQFLGKVIRLTANHRAVVEEKPEVRKAGGVYYTPTYIVDYIVKQTVGKLLEGKTPRTAARLKILDPACGSGSFLIGAYQFLLDWHRDWYTTDGAEKHTRVLYQMVDGQWRLTTGERRRILLNNIYGVDIDAQAVETTKLSLLLKVLEGENEQTLNRQLRFFHERALPDLGSNIKCGNSLIGPDFYDTVQLGMIDEEEQLRINTFDWDREFSDIMGKGGFDAMIGNPPWLMAAYHDAGSLDYLRRNFASARGKFDLYYLFIERGVTLLNRTGSFGMIIPNKLFHTRSASALREALATDRLVDQIVDFGDEQLFTGATNYSCLLFLDRNPKAEVRYSSAKAGLELVSQFTVPQSTLLDGTWHFENQEVSTLFAKLESQGVPLTDITSRFGTGVQTGADRLLVFDQKDLAKLDLENEVLRPIIRGRDVRRYRVSNDLKFVLFPYTDGVDDFSIMTEDEVKAYPKANDYLVHNRQKLGQRIWFGKNAEQLTGQWFGMMYLDSLNAFKSPHLLTPSLSNRSNFALGTGNLFVTGTAGVTSVIPKDDIGESIFFLLGILNSRLLSFYATRHSPIFSGKYYKFSAPYLKQLPIYTIDFSNSTDVARHDRMVALVQQMLDLNVRLAEERMGQTRAFLERQIEMTDRQIDRLVYELYGLSDEEIRIVEEATS